MKTALTTAATVVVVCGTATALAYLLGARGHAFQTISAVTWGLSIPTAAVTALISVARRKDKERAG